MSTEPYDIYIDYNKHALIDMRNKKKPGANADKEGLDGVRSTVMDLNEVAFDDNITKSSVFAATSTAPIAKVDGQQDLVAPAVDSGIIIEGDDSEADSKRFADFRIPLEGGYFHKQSEADRMAGRIYVLSAVSGKVVAAADGKVIYVGDRKRGDKLKNYNNLIIVEHDGQTMSVYADVDNIYIKPGDQVKVGERIADVKKKHGRDFELNFAMRANKKEIINPKDYIKNKP